MTNRIPRYSHSPDATRRNTKELTVSVARTLNDMRKYVKNGTVEAFELWDPAKLGDLAARTAVALVSGQITGKEGETFKAGGTEYTIGKDGVINLGKPTVFNAKNIDQFNF